MGKETLSLLTETEFLMQVPDSRLIGDNWISGYNLLPYETLVSHGWRETIIHKDTENSVSPQEHWYSEEDNCNHVHFIDPIIDDSPGEP